MFYIQYIMSFSVVFAVAIGWWRYSQMTSPYKPLFWLMVGGLVTEVSAIISAVLFRTNTAIYSLFSLVELALILLLFHRWGSMPWLSRYIWRILAVITGLWLVENVIIPSTTSFSSFFHIARAFAVVLLSIRQLNTSIWEERGNLLQNTKFLTCLAFLLFFIFSILVELFWMYGLTIHAEFRRNIYFILSVVNVIANLIFAFALLWTPIKPKFLLLSSSPVSC